MASKDSDDFLIQYRTIGQSLKKRFFRKPNVADAIDQYESLFQELRHDKQREFAAICSLEQAKCYESVQDVNGQTTSLVRGAKYMIDASKDIKMFMADDGRAPYGDKMGGRADGQVQVAVQALDECIKIHAGLGNQGLVTLLHIKIGEILTKNNYFGQALRHFEEALKISEANFGLPDQIIIVEKIVKYRVKVHELESASQMVADYLERATKYYASHPSSMCKDFLVKFQITRVCLLLLVGSDSVDLIGFLWPEGSCGGVDVQVQQRRSKMYSNLKGIIESLKESKEPKIEEKEPKRRSYSMHACLKDLVLAVQRGSVEEIQIAQTRLGPILDLTHRDLFRALIQLH